jgi:hypothetical protein
MAPYRPTGSEMADTLALAEPRQRDWPPAPLRGPTPEPVSPPLTALGNTPSWEPRPVGARALSTPAPHLQIRDPAPEEREVVRDSRPSIPSLPAVPLATPTSLLSAIGLLTKARPFLVLGGASIGALVLVLTLLGAARLIERHRAAAAAQPSQDMLTGAVPAALPGATVHHQERSNAQPTQ